MQRLFDKLKQFDKFGSGAGFTIKGSETYGTSLGLVLTLIIYTIVLIYGRQNYMKLMEKADTAHQQVLEENVVPVRQEFTLGDLEANFAFGLWSNQFQPINLTQVEDYVQIQALMMNYDYDSEKGQTATV